MSTHICGCDPEAGWRCDRHLAYDRDKEIPMDPREERIEKTYAQNTTRPTNPLKSCDERGLKHALTRQSDCIVCKRNYSGAVLEEGSFVWVDRDGFPFPAIPRLSTNACSLDEVKAFRTRMFEASMALIDKKGADYNRDQQNSGDTLFNLRVAEILGIVPSTEEGILVRLSDKFMRLISLTKPGREAEVKDESVLDTIRDMENYLDYLGLIWLKRRNP